MHSNFNQVQVEMLNLIRLTKRLGEWDLDFLFWEFGQE